MKKTVINRVIASILLLSSAHVAVADTELGGEFVVAKSSRVGASVSLGGTIIPHREVNLVAKMPGDVLFIAGEEGDSFSKGDRLATRGRRHRRLAVHHPAQVLLQFGHQAAPIPRYPQFVASDRKSLR